MFNYSKDNKHENEKENSCCLYSYPTQEKGRVLCQKRKLREGTLAPPTHCLMISVEAHYTSRREMDINYASLHSMKKNSKEG